MDTEYGLHPETDVSWAEQAICHGLTHVFFGPASERPERRAEREAIAAIVKGYNRLTGARVKLGKWDEYLAMRSGMLRLNEQYRDMLSNDLGALAGLLFDLGIGPGFQNFKRQLAARGLDHRDRRAADIATRRLHVEREINLVGGEHGRRSGENQQRGRDRTGQNLSHRENAGDTVDVARIVVNLLDECHWDYSSDAVASGCRASSYWRWR